MSQVSRIAINLRYSNTKPSTQDDEVTVEYLWGRIAFALIACLLIIFTCIWLFFGHSNTDQMNTPTEQAVPVITPAPTPFSPAPIISHQKPVPLVKPSDKTNTAIANPKPSVKPIKEATALEVVDSADVKATTAVKPMPVKPMAVKPVPVKPIALKPVSSDINITKNKQAKIQIKSSRVFSAQLSLKQKPTEADALPYTLRVKPAQILKVHFVTDYRNLKGRWVYHDWYRNNKRMARVSLHPARNKQLAFSSKNIDSNMLGAWQVKVIDQNNTLLAIGEFEVQQSQ